mgnify:CR=1 FL=1|tara:strand:- start:321 stop:428 length:108 start_codon:yes stop_codon:yes gene_type:complete
MIKVFVTGTSEFVGQRLVSEIDILNKKNMNVLVVF